MSLDESGLETSLVLVAPAPYIPTLADPTMQMVGQPQQVWVSRKSLRKRKGGELDDVGTLGNEDGGVQAVQFVGRPLPGFDELGYDDL